MKTTGRAKRPSLLWNYAERERESRLEQKINYVLKKIENKSFGYCELCNNKIGIERLLARPVAVLCFDCKNLQELQEKIHT